jgi:hypothetical protein
MRPRSLAAFVLLAAVVPSVGACRSRRLFNDPPPAGTVAAASAAAPASRTPPAPSRTPPPLAARNPAPSGRALVPPQGFLGSRPGRGGFVQLSRNELLPLDAWIDFRNAQWILGDEVLVEASREYFGPQLSVVQRTGSVQRHDEVLPDVTITTLTFLMGPLQAAVENNPRVMIGTGLTITARRVLRLRLFKTTDGSTPVQLRITAGGDASRGRRDQVEQRGAMLQVGGSMRRGPRGWAWVPLP